MDQNSAAELHQQVLSLSTAISSSGGGLTASIQRLSRDLESTAKSLVKDATSFTDARAQNERAANREFDRNLQNVNDNSKRIGLAMRTLESSLKNNSLGLSIQETAKMLAQSSQLAMNEFHAQVSAATKSASGLPKEFSNVYQQLTGLRTKLATAADFEALDDYVAMQRKLIVMQQSYTDNIAKVSQGMIQADAGARRKYLDNIQAFVELSKEHNVNFMQFIREDDVAFKEKIATSLAQNKKLAGVLSDAEIDKLAQAFDSTALLQNHAKIIEGTNAVAVALQNHATSAKTMLKEAAIKRAAAESALVNSIVSVQKDMRELGRVRPETVHAGMMAGVSTIFKGISDVLKSAQTLMIGPAAIAMQQGIEPARVAAADMGLSSEQLQQTIASNIDIARKMAGGQEEYSRAMQAGYRNYMTLSGGNPEIAAKMEQQQLRFIDLTSAGNLTEAQRNKLMVDQAQDLRTLSTITKMASPALSEWQAGLLQDSEFRNSLMLMNDQERVNLSNTMKASIGLFTSFKFTEEAALKLTEQFIKLRGSTTAKTRYQQANKLALAASQAGMSPQQISDMRTLYMQGKTTSEEFIKLFTLLSTRQGELKASGMGSDSFAIENWADNIAKLIPENMSQLSKEITQQALLEGNKNKDSTAGKEVNKALKDNEARKKSGEDVTTGSNDVLTNLWGEIDTKVGTISKYVETFGGAIKGVGEMVAGAAQVALLTQIAINTGGLSNLKSLIPGLGGKGGKPPTIPPGGTPAGNAPAGTTKYRKIPTIPPGGTPADNALTDIGKYRKPPTVPPGGTPAGTLPADIGKYGKLKMLGGSLAKSGGVVLAGTALNAVVDNDLQKQGGVAAGIDTAMSDVLPWLGAPGRALGSAWMGGRTIGRMFNKLGETRDDKGNITDTWGSRIYDWTHGKEQAELNAPVAIKPKTPNLPVNPAQATPDSFAAEMLRDRQKQIADRMKEQQASDKKASAGLPPPDLTSKQMLTAINTLNKNFEDYAQFYRDVESDKAKSLTLDIDRTRKTTANQ
jgi:hypothetical protein